MNRDIKFRVWDGTDMHEAFYLEDHKDKHQSPVLVGMKTIGTWLQFTGLKDKNGKEIYEGDIVNVRNWGRTDEVLAIARVCWDEDEAGWNWETANGSLESTVDDYDRWRRIEVIGNVYENPDLLKN